MSNILNLREHDDEQPVSTGDHDIVPPQAEPGELPADDEGEERPPAVLAALAPEVVAWQASTKPGALERRKEHVMLGALGALAIVVAVWQRSFPLVAIAGLAILAWEMQHRHGHDVEVTIDQNGIGVNGRRHRFDRLASFHIQELPDGSRHLSVMPASALSPAVRAPLGDQSHEEVRAILSTYLVEDEHPVPISELFLKS